MCKYLRRNARTIIFDAEVTGVERHFHNAPLRTVANGIIQQITEIILQHNVRTIVAGYPRNQSGEPTKQTELVEKFVEQLAEIDIEADIVFQDESLTSVEAERRLGRVKDKGEIDAEAASIILQDYLEQEYAN